jgi:hypothetical protein
MLRAVSSFFIVLISEYESLIYRLSLCWTLYWVYFSNIYIACTKHSLVDVKVLFALYLCQRLFV